MRRLERAPGLIQPNGPAAFCRAFHARSASRPQSAAIPIERTVLASIPHHPNDAGTWTRLEGLERFALWRRERRSLPPVTMYYVVAPPRQNEILYDEAKARARFAEVSGFSGGDAAVRASRKDDDSPDRY